MFPDRVSNPGPLTYESGALPIALRGPAFVVCCCLVWGTKARPRARVGRPQTCSSPPVILLLAVPRWLDCLWSLVILDVVCHYLSLVL